MQSSGGGGGGGGGGGEIRGGGQFNLPPSNANASVNPPSNHHLISPNPPAPTPNPSPNPLLYSTNPAHLNHNNAFHHHFQNSNQMLLLSATNPSPNLIAATNPTNPSVHSSNTLNPINNISAHDQILLQQLQKPIYDQFQQSGREFEASNDGDRDGDEEDEDVDDSEEEESEDNEGNNTIVGMSRQNLLSSSNSMGGMRQQEVVGAMGGGRSSSGMGMIGQQAGGGGMVEAGDPDEEAAGILSSVVVTGATEAAMGPGGDGGIGGGAISGTDISNSGGIGGGGSGSIMVGAAEEAIIGASGAAAAVSGSAEMMDEGDGMGGSGGGGSTRWPRTETLALLRIRSEMDASFRDSSLKRPLWDEVSRKLSELGYDRSAKKCKEKFENVHKYYKRTKEGKAGRQDGKSYRFFTELEALYGGGSSTNPNVLTANPSLISSNPKVISTNYPRSVSFAEVSGAGPNAIWSDATPNPLVNNTPQTRNSKQSRSDARIRSSDKSSSETSSSDSDDNEEEEDDDDDDDEDNDINADDLYDDYEERRPAHNNLAHSNSKKRKRRSTGRLMAFFEKLLKKVMEKQEQMQEKFLEALERREKDRMIREEAWMRQEMARMSREREARDSERSFAASREAAIVAFLHKMGGQSGHANSPGQPTSGPIAAQPIQSHAPVGIANNPPLVQAPPNNIPADSNDPGNIPSSDDLQLDPFDPTSKRWPKPEVLSLIELRTRLHPRFVEPGPKGLLWEEISNGMSKLGYSRSPKRCKEKWENINKYFKKAKESNKNRPENAKTCPYYHQLDALYKQGVLSGAGAGAGNITTNLVKQLSYKQSAAADTQERLLDGNGNEEKTTAMADDTGARLLAIVAHTDSRDQVVLAGATNNNTPNTQPAKPPSSSVLTPDDTIPPGTAHASSGPGNVNTITTSYTDTVPYGASNVNTTMPGHHVPVVGPDDTTVEQDIIGTSSRPGLASNTNAGTSTEDHHRSS